MKNYLFFLVATFIMLTLVVSSCFSSKSISSGPSVNWLTFSQVQDSLRHSPKKVLVDVYASWCGPCKKMDKMTYTNPDVVNYLNEHFYAVKFDAESMDTINFKSIVFTNSLNKNHTHNLTYELAMVDGRIAFPTTTFFDPQLNKIETVATFLYPVEMLELLHQIQEKLKANN